MAAIAPILSSYNRLARSRSSGRLFNHVRASAFSSQSSSFFSQTSGRSKRRERRRQRLKRQRPPLGSTSSEQEEQVDDRTVRDILFPRPIYGAEPEESTTSWPRTLGEWRSVFTDSVALYRSTWDGFFTSRSFLVEDKKEGEEVKGSDIQKVAEKKRDEVTENVRKNIEFVRDASENIRTETGINDKEDLRRWAGDMMRLASSSLNHFMEGYRKGRDEEVEKVLTQYFQELEEKANQPRRRRRKRRILSIK